LIGGLLQTEIGGLEVYRAALRRALNEELKQEWKEYLASTPRRM
jgi:hypothetical protein